jgi:glycerate kinase
VKIVIAPQAFKGSLSALNVANAVQKGVRRIFPDAQILMCPVADGGDGTLETLVESSGGKIMKTYCRSMGSNGRRKYSSNRDG